MTTETVLSPDEVKRLKKEVLIVWADDKGITEFARAIEQAVLQSPEVQRLREDAERYRVLRDEEYQMQEDDPCVTDDSFNTFFGEDLDKAVDALKSRRDAAMKERP